MSSWDYYADCDCCGFTAYISFGNSTFAPDPCPECGVGHYKAKWYVYVGRWKRLGVWWNPFTWGSEMVRRNDE